MTDVFRRTVRITAPESLGDSQMISHLNRLEEHSPHYLQEWIRMAMRNQFQKEPNLINSIRGDVPVDASGQLQTLVGEHVIEVFIKTLRINPPVDSVDSQMVARLKVIEEHSPHYIQEWIRVSMRNQFLKDQQFLFSIQGEVNEG